MYTYVCAYNIHIILYKKYNLLYTSYFYLIFNILYIYIIFCKWIFISFFKCTMVFLNEIKIQFRETIGGTPSRARGIQSTAKFPTRISEYLSLCFTNEETKVQRDEVTHLRSPSSNMGVGSISRDLFPAQCLSYLPTPWHMQLEEGRWGLPGAKKMPQADPTSFNYSPLSLVIFK